VLNGRKRWIGLGSVADLVVVWARNTEDGQVNGFVVEKGSPGYQARVIEGKVSLRSVWQAEITLDNVRVPAENRLPGARSFKDTTRVLATTRSTCAWGALGHATAAYDVALRYAQERRQFGESLASFQIIQQRLVSMLADLTAMQLYCLQIGRLAEAGRLTPTVAGLAKMHNTRKARVIAADARDMLGGNGILLDYQVMRHMVDMEAIHTFEGTETMQTLTAATPRPAATPLAVNGTYLVHGCGSPHSPLHTVLCAGCHNQHKETPPQPGTRGGRRAVLPKPPLFLADGGEDRSALHRVFRLVLPQRDDQFLLRLAGQAGPHLREIPEYALPRRDVVTGPDGGAQERVGRRLPGHEVVAVRHVGEDDVDVRRRDAGRVAVNTGDLLGELPPGGFVKQAFGTAALVNGHGFLPESDRKATSLTVKAKGNAFIVSRARTIGPDSYAWADARPAGR
jgi:hypothetical protein